MVYREIHGVGAPSPKSLVDRFMFVAGGRVAVGGSVAVGRLMYIHTV